MADSFDFRDMLMDPSIPFEQIPFEGIVFGDFDSRKESYYGGLYACSAGNDDVEMFRTEIFAYLFENEVVSYA